MKRKFFYFTFLSIVITAISIGSVFAAQANKSGDRPITRDHERPSREEKGDHEDNLDARKQSEIHRVERAIERIENREAFLEARAEFTEGLSAANETLVAPELVNNTDALAQLEDIKETLLSADTSEELDAGTQSLTDLIAPAQQ